MFAMSKSDAYLYLYAAAVGAGRSETADAVARQGVADYEKFRAERDAERDAAADAKYGRMD